MALESPTPKPGNNGRYATRKPTARSRVSNHRDVLPNTDGRSFVVRRYRDIASAIFGDQGGLDACSESRVQLIRRFSAACVMAEQMEAKLANGEEINVERHALLVSSMVRITRQLGLSRIARNITPSLHEYLSNQGAAE